MHVDFELMDRHRSVPVSPPSGGRIVLSRLGAGRSQLTASAPSIKLVLQGEEIYEIDGESYRIGAGQYLFLDVGRPCAAVIRNSAVGFCLALPDLATPSQPRSSDNPFGRAIPMSASTSALGQMLLRQGERLARNPDLGLQYAPAIVAAATAGVVEPLGQTNEVISRLKAAKPSTRREIFQRLERARAFLHDHLDRGIALGELASVAGLSQFHLARYFKLAFGSAPIAYHRALRLARAGEMIASGKGSVAQAAEATGYSDPVALTHAFRRHYGHPPLQWARQAAA